MIKVYYRGSCGSSKRALAWFDKYNLEVECHQISKMHREDLITLLRFSEEGLKDIVKRPGKSSSEVKKALQYMEHLSFNEALDFLLAHPYLLQTPIIMKEKHHLIGFNEDEIRIFLPKDYRRQHF